ncbi:hypothetical protein [Clostridium uliginosum]|uniref:Uncharacterized protein n=1 Tax=Clostridium uliginosum TaxID=119641 RepID=A0A1I1JSL1_9CLOT|nr:hypothetical protein [Clostridium uliginosum]SFC51355.1 hypothetical protein SAMN05421842_104147 [Clostridium uliginosum]
MCTDSKYDMPIIILCFLIIIFVSTMISSEVEKSKTKFRDSIIGVLLIIAIIVFGNLASIFKIFEYVAYVLFFMCGIFILSRDTMSLCVKKKYFNLRSESIRLKHNETINSIVFIIFLFQTLALEGNFSFIEIYVLIVLLIDLPLDYIANHYLYVYENGISIGTFSFPKKVIPYNKIVPYSKIQNLTFLEYDKNKFTLQVQTEKSSYKYRLKGEDKEEMISFIRNFIEEEKVIILKESF